MVVQKTTYKSLIGASRTEFKLYASGIVVSNLHYFEIVVSRIIMRILSGATVTILTNQYIISLATIIFIVPITVIVILL